MIHRFLIYDRKFNCRLDRRYPLNQYSTFNLNSLTKPIKKVPIIKLEQEESKIKVNTNSPWNTLMIKSELEDSDSDSTEEGEVGISVSSKGSLVSQLSRLELELELEPGKGKGKGEIVEHSQQLILGLTYSLKNMFLKLSPTPLINTQNTFTPVEGYSFSLKTSKYRLYYFESFTGWKLVMITDCNQPNNSINSSIYGQILPETALKIFYTQVLLNFLLTYPLGTVYTLEKSTQSEKVVVENDFLHRPGFLSKMDEFIQISDRIF